MSGGHGGVKMAFLLTFDAMGVSAMTEEYRRTRADEPNFIALGDPPTVHTREFVCVHSCAVDKGTGGAAPPASRPFHHDPAWR